MLNCSKIRWFKNVCICCLSITRKSWVLQNWFNSDWLFLRNDCGNPRILACRLIFWYVSWHITPALFLRVREIKVLILEQFLLKDWMVCDWWCGSNSAFKVYRIYFVEHMFSMTGLSTGWEWRNKPFDDNLTDDSFCFSILATWFLKFVSVFDWTKEYWLEAGFNSPCYSKVVCSVWPIFSESSIAYYSFRIACWLSKNCLFNSACCYSSKNFLSV